MWISSVCTQNLSSTFWSMARNQNLKISEPGCAFCFLLTHLVAKALPFATFSDSHLLDQDFLAQVRRFVLHSCLSQEPKELEKAGVASPGRGQSRNYARYRCRGSTSLISQRSNMPHLPSTCPQCPTTSKVPAKAYCIKYSTPGPDKAVSPREFS